MKFATDFDDFTIVSQVATQLIRSHFKGSDFHSKVLNPHLWKIISPASTLLVFCLHLLLKPEQKRVRVKK
jgi:uncharacterized BrkB/YihY/UPF0761 family membrane protein